MAASEPFVHISNKSYNVRVWKTSQSNSVLIFKLKKEKCVLMIKTSLLMVRQI